MPLQEPQHDALLLLGAELLDGLEQRRVGDAGQHLVLGAVGAALGAGLDQVRGRELQLVATGLEVVGDQVAGDRDQPGAEVAALPGVGRDPAQRAQERLAGEVLGERVVGDPVGDVAVDDVDVPVVELAERLAVAGLRALTSAMIAACSPAARPEGRRASGSAGSRGLEVRRGLSSAGSVPRRAARPASTPRSGPGCPRGDRNAMGSWTRPERGSRAIATASRSAASPSGSTRWRAGRGAHVCMDPASSGSGARARRVSVHRWCCLMTHRTNRTRLWRIRAISHSHPPHDHCETSLGKPARLSSGACPVRPRRAGFAPVDHRLVAALRRRSPPARSRSAQVRRRRRQVVLWFLLAVVVGVVAFGSGLVAAPLDYNFQPVAPKSVSAARLERPPVRDHPLAADRGSGARLRRSRP